MLEYQKKMLPAIISPLYLGATKMWGGSYIKKVFNETLGHYSDRRLTIPVGTDSQSAMDTGDFTKRNE
jgi:hypothetical protein